jgi:antitoxin CptB
MLADEVESESRRRLRWQCRRGLLELDLLFLRFIDERFDQASAADQAAFGTLLTQSDQTLLAWVQGQETAPIELQSILKKVI